MGLSRQGSIAIILVNWNGYRHTAACLTSLKKVPTENFKIIVVDNASTDSSLDQLKVGFPEVVFLENTENKGFAGGNNVGIDFAIKEGFEYVMLLNNDTIVEPGFLTPLLRFFQSQQKCQVGMVQPLIKFMHDKTTIWSAGGLFNKWLGISHTIGNGKTELPRDIQELDWVTGCCTIMPTIAIREVGALNENYFAYFEDVDWALRMGSRGYRHFIVPEALIYHEAGASSTTAKQEGTLQPIVFYYLSRNQFFQLKQHVKFPLSIIAWVYHLSKFLGWMGYFLLRNRPSKLRALWFGIRDGIMLHPGKTIPLDWRRDELMS
jgi:GT2 family glycosyltransferase